MFNWIKDINAQDIQDVKNSILCSLKKVFNFAKSADITAHVSAKSKKKTMMIYGAIFAGLMVINALLFSASFSVYRVLMAFGIVSGFAVHDLFKDVLGKREAATAGITVALAFLMFSVFVKILL